MPSVWFAPSQDTPVKKLLIEIWFIYLWRFRVIYLLVRPIMTILWINNKPFQVESLCISFNGFLKVSCLSELPYVLSAFATLTIWLDMSISHIVIGAFCLLRLYLDFYCRFRILAERVNLPLYWDQLQRNILWIYWYYK